MPHQICFKRKPAPGHVFVELNEWICIPLYYEIPKLWPKEPDPSPWSQLSKLATIVDLASSLPSSNPLREDLVAVATRSLETAVADLGDDVRISEVDAHAAS